MPVDNIDAGFKFEHLYETTSLIVEESSTIQQIDEQSKNIKKLQDMKEIADMRSPFVRIPFSQEYSNVRNLFR